MNFSLKHRLHRSAPCIRTKNTNGITVWKCLECMEEFPYLDNSDLPKPHLTAPITDPDFLKHWSNRSMVTKKNLTNPTILDRIKEILQ